MKIRSGILLIAAMSILVGCGTTSTRDHVDALVRCEIPKDSRPAPKGPALVSEEYGLKTSPIPLDAVLFTNQKLADTLAVQGLYATKTATGTVQISARLLNCTNKAIQLRMRVSFFSKSLAPAEKESMWKTVFVPAHATGVYTELSMSRNGIANYLVEIAAEQED